MKAGFRYKTKRKTLKNKIAQASP